MTAIYWAVGLVILIPVVCGAIVLTLSFVVPERVSGVELLKKELAKGGVQFAHVPPPEFFDECVEWSQRCADAVGFVKQSRIARKGELAEAISTIANMVGLWQQNPRDSMFKTYGPEENAYVEIFKKYDLARPEAQSPLDGRTPR